MPSPNARLLPFVVGGTIVALLGWTLVQLAPVRHSGASRPLGLIVGVGLLCASCVIAVRAPTRSSAWRRLFLFAAALSFAIAGLLWAVPPMAASPETIQGARAENAPGIALFILLAVLMLALLASPAFIALGLLLAALAWLLGREPELRSVARHHDV